MPLIRVDLRLLDIYFELWALEEHLVALEDNIAFVRSQDRIRTEAQLQEGGFSQDESEVQLAFQEHDQRVNHVLPRYLRGSFLVALWAVYEAAIGDIADHLRARAGVALRLSDFRGDFLERARKYFEHVLHRDLMPDKSTAEALGRLLLLRNAFAHANGRLDAIRGNDVSTIRK